MENFIADFKMNFLSTFWFISISQNIIIYSQNEAAFTAFSFSGKQINKLIAHFVCN